MAIGNPLQVFKARSVKKVDRIYADITMTFVQFVFVATRDCAGIHDKEHVRLNFG